MLGAYRRAAGLGLSQPASQTGEAPSAERPRERASHACKLRAFSVDAVSRRLFAGRSMSARRGASRSASRRTSCEALVIARLEEGLSKARRREQSACSSVPPRSGVSSTDGAPAIHASGALAHAAEARLRRSRGNARRPLRVPPKVRPAQPRYQDSAPRHRGRRGRLPPRPPEDGTPGSTRVFEREFFAASSVRESRPSEAHATRESGGAPAA
jgi:hypothetical protein